jgi:hypothetical protein
MCISAATLAVAATALVSSVPAADALAPAPTATLAATSPANTLEPPTATAPTELVALEEKMRTLQVTSEQLDLATFIGDPGGPSKGKHKHSHTKLIPVVTLSGDEQLSPAAGSFTVSGLSKHRTQARVVGGNFYFYDPEIGRHDHGRGWVQLPQASATEGVGLNPAAPNGTNTVGSGTGPFASLINDLSAAETLEEVGPTTVDGQAVTEFTAKIAPARLGLYSATQLGALEKLGTNTVEMSVFIAPTGLPTRTEVTIAFGGGEAVVRSDILAVNVPVAVQAPPADQTISEARFRKIESRLVREELKKLARKAKHRHH